MFAQPGTARNVFARFRTALGFLAGIASTGCLVGERCYEDLDCAGSKICSAEGLCIFECSVHQDCDAHFGEEYNCVSGHCVVAPECTACGFPHAEHRCVHGDCQLVACDTDYFDRDEDPKTGCEYRCESGKLDANQDPEDGCECTPSVTGEELCNELDDDCDGQIDEDFDLFHDPNHCGACHHTCPTPPNAEPLCSSGVCQYQCLPGTFDNDLLADNGCEAAACTPVLEMCNGRDDDCNCPGDTNGDGVSCGPGDEGVDEGFDHTLPSSCGPYCVLCSLAHATPSCVDGVCRIASCAEGSYDLDGLDTNGCEYLCTYSGEELCNQVDDDCDGLIDEGEVCLTSCPEDMVTIGHTYCIDRYEASRPDATATSSGTDNTRALSRPGVLPWMANPMTAEHLVEFENACTASGKTLCSAEHWHSACTGPAVTTFVYGSTFDREICNSVDTFCDDYCTEQGLASCSTSENCGYTYNCFHAVPTGSFTTCTNEYGTFDINGNAWEVVLSTSDARGYEVRGGAFNCASPSVRVNCSYNASWSELYAGFRCCKPLD